MTGSVAYDTIMVFPGRFGDHILPDKTHLINVSFQVDRLERRRFSQRPIIDEHVCVRRVGLDLTEEGERVLRRVRSRRTAWLAARLRELTPEQLEALEDALPALGALVGEPS